MDCRISNGELVLSVGSLGPTYWIRVQDVRSWGFVGEAHGTTYFVFELPDSTQHVSVPSIEPGDLMRLLRSLEGLLGTPPVVNIAESRVDATLLAVGISLDVLVQVLSSMR